MVVKIYETLLKKRLKSSQYQVFTRINKAAVVVAKYGDLFLILVDALGSLKCFLQSCYMKIDFNQFININIVYENLGTKISAFFPATFSHLLSNHIIKLNVGNVHAFKKVCKDPSSLLPEKLFKSQSHSWFKL